MMPITQISGLQKLLTTNATDASFASKVATVTQPTGDAVFTLSGDTGGIKTSGRLKFVFFGVGSNDNTFKARLVGWDLSPSGLYIPIPLFQVTCTLSTAVGVDGEDVDDSERFVDTLSLESGFGIANENNWLFNPANNVVAHAVVLDMGLTRFEMQFDMNSSATSANVLWGVK